MLAVAIPMILSSGTQSLMHVVDRVFLTWYSKESVAAALPAGLLFWSCLSLPIGIVSYLNAFVAQYDGAKKPGQVSSCVWQGIYFSLFCSVLLMLPAIGATWIFESIGHAPEVRRLEAAFFRWICLGGAVALLPAALSCFFSGRGQTMVVLAVSASAVLVNAVLDALLIFGFGPIPRLGIVGAAVATNLANVYATVCYIALLYWHSVRGPYKFWNHRAYDRILMYDLFKFGGPSGLQMFLDVAGFTAFIMIVGWIGPSELAATNLTFNLNTLAFTPVIGLGIAVSTLVGQRIGEGRPDVAARSTWKAFILGSAMTLFCGAFYIFLPHILLKPYALHASDVDFAQTQNTVILLLRFVAIYSFFDSMAIVFGSAIRSAGDTVFSMVVTCASAWGILVIPTYLTWKLYKPDLFMSWVWCSAYVIVLGFVFVWRFSAGKWKTMSIMEPTIDEDEEQPETGALVPDGHSTDLSTTPRIEERPIPRVTEARR